ncbi:MAG TPA: hypothetical protein PLQ68_00685 [Clostridia bacterium]|nr:hypothetical protein [Clostridia bacterium]
MYNIKTSTDLSLLHDKGILLSFGEICWNKINLISGAMTAPLVEAIWAFTENDAESMERILVTLNHLYHNDHKVEMIAVLRILYDVSGLQFPEDVQLLAEHPKTRQYFLFSFLLDMDDCMQEFMTEELKG